MTDSHRAPTPSLFQTFTSDVRSVLGAVRKHGLRRDVNGMLSGLEAFYLSEEERRNLAAMSSLRRGPHRGWWLIKSLLMKLTPAQRVLLAVAFIVIAMGVSQDENQGLVLGSVLLISLVMLELKDKLLARDELEAGRAVQLAFLPEHSPAVPG